MNLKNCLTNLFMEQNIKRFFENYIRLTGELYKQTSAIGIDKHVYQIICDYIFDKEIMKEFYVLKKIYDTLQPSESFNDWIANTGYEQFTWICTKVTTFNDLDKFGGMEPYYVQNCGKMAIKSVEFSYGGGLVDKISDDVLSMWDQIKGYNKTKIQLNDNYKIVAMRINGKDAKGHVPTDIYKLKHLKYIDLRRFKNRDFTELCDNLPAGISLQY